MGASLVVQWLRIHLPMLGTWFDPWSLRACAPQKKPQQWETLIWSLSGRIPHARGQLGPCATATEALIIESMLHKRSHHNEKPQHCNEGWCPPSLQLEKPRGQHWGPKIHKQIRRDGVVLSPSLLASPLLKLLVLERTRGRVSNISGGTK